MADKPADQPTPDKPAADNTPTKPRHWPVGCPRILHIPLEDEDAPPDPAGPKAGRLLDRLRGRD